MKHYIFLAIGASLMLTGCFATRIVTVSPVSGFSGTSTTVTVPKAAATTTTTRVTAVSEDISLCLDLQAVGAAFAQSSTIEEFENLLNNSSYMLSNLDLNGDGYVDYLRVVETLEGSAHVFVIQAVLAENVYQDVATLVAEVTTVYANACVQIIGAPYIYGPNYIVQPVYVAVPAIYPYLVRGRYSPWRSPWYWGHFPAHYKRPAPVYVSHYHAYVNTFMRNHRYCNEFKYATSCHYPDYVRVSEPVRRNDYGKKYPERSFVERNANTPASSVPGQQPRNVVNARDLREAVNAETVTRTAQSSSTTTRTAQSSSTATTRTAQSSSSAGNGSRSRTVSPASSDSSSRSASGTTQTTVRSNVSSSGSARTRISTTSSSGTSTRVNRSATSSRSSSSVNRSSGSSGSASKSTTSSGSTGRSSSSSGSAGRSSSNSGSAGRSTGGSGSTGSSSRSGSRR